MTRSLVREIEREIASDDINCIRFHGMCIWHPRHVDIRIKNVSTPDSAGFTEMITPPVGEKWLIHPVKSAQGISWHINLEENVAR